MVGGARGGRPVCLQGRGSWYPCSGVWPHPTPVCIWAALIRGLKTEDARLGAGQDGGLRGGGGEK